MFAHDAAAVCLQIMRRPYVGRLCGGGCMSAGYAEDASVSAGMRVDTTFASGVAVLLLC